MALHPHILKINEVCVCVCVCVRARACVCEKINVSKVTDFGNTWSKVGGLVCQLRLTFVWFINQQDIFTLELTF